jgi:NAD(P)-dependent dehydrogenase (short-subunit alcohol dehydrogenase family)
MSRDAKKLPAISKLIDLTGRRAVVTGAAQGMGLAIAKRLAEAGASIVIGDINQPLAATSLVTLPPARSLSHAAWDLDVRSGASVSRFAKQISEVYGGADIWINAAGIFPTQPFREMTEAQWDEMLNINLRGIFLCGRAAAELLIEGATKNGVIVNISSTSGHRGRPGLAHYVASKHGVEGLTKSMALELGAHGIRVIAVAPALTRTEGLEARRQSNDASRNEETAALEKRVAQSIPLGRIAEPDDVARVVLFLASDLASFITGSSVLVDGGQLAY